MPAAPDYSIVIPAYNEAQMITDTLKQAKRAMAASALRGELLVVDNNSDDTTAALAQKAGARVLWEPINQISRARNTGARAALGRYLVFLDADTQLSEGLLATALANLDHHDCIGGGALIAADQSPTPRAQKLIDGWNRLSLTLRVAAGCFMYCRADAFKAVGGFSERVYASEEIWFSRALKQQAVSRDLVFRIINEPKVRTSLRKLEWYTARELFIHTLVILFPFALRSRRLCAFWYRRPKQSVSRQNVD